MQRREFITLLGGAAATWPIAARGQQPNRMKRVVVMDNYDPSDGTGRARTLELQQGLESLGWVNDRNIKLDFRYIHGNSEAAKTFAKELLALQPDLIVAGNSISLDAIQNEAHSAPIVFYGISDPVERGLVASFEPPR